MDIEILKTFLRVAQLKNIYKAADELFISQSTVISRIRVLEENLGNELFIRHGRGVQLTDQGSLMLDYVQRTLELLEEGMREVNSKSMISGGFKLGSVTAAASYLLPSVLGEFRAKHPGIGIHLETASTSMILDWVMNGKVEIGFIRGPFEHKGVDAVNLSSDPIIPVVSGNHSWAQKRTVMADDFASQTILASDRKSSIWISITDWLKKQGIVPRIGMEVDHIETTKEMVTHNMVVAFVPFMAVRKEVEEGRLVKVNLHPPLELYRDTLMIRHRRKPLSPHAEELWRFLESKTLSSNLLG